MVLNKKGQFFLITAVLMITIVVGIAYYTSQAKQTELKVMESPLAHNIAEQYANELSWALESKIYDGDSNAITNVIQDMNTTLNSLGYASNITCDESQSGNQFHVNCTLRINSTDTTIEKTMSYDYTVPYAVSTYEDNLLAYENDAFPLGSTVYYRITGNDTDLVNISVYDPNGNLKYTKNETLSNWHADGSFSIASTDTQGTWSIKLNGTLKKNLRVYSVNITIKTYDSNWFPQDMFVRGEMVRYKVFLRYSNGTSFDTIVNLDVTNAIGRATSYGSQGDTSSGTFGGNFTIDTNEITGNMTLTAVEHRYYAETTKDITVLSEPYQDYVALSENYISFNIFHTDVFGENCGYTGWYSESSQTYNGIPFYVSTSGNTNLNITNAETVKTPHVYAERIYFISSMGET
ncbi:MAG: hypothetical protein J7K68_03480 [Candidatus Diapherotrites archaeon]|nr:hypothetical protein [Candidatus Diapherotrites archaeon]